MSLVRPSPRTSEATTRSASPSSDEHSTVNVLLVDAPSEQAVRQRPEIAPRLANGWKIRSASPRVVETDGAMWLVVLERSPTFVSLQPSLSMTLTSRLRREKQARRRLETTNDFDLLNRSPSDQGR